jgi:hypothetical protein
MTAFSPYWRSVTIRAFWDSLRAFETNPRLLLLGLLGAVVTAALPGTPMCSQMFH